MNWLTENKIKVYKPNNTYISNTITPIFIHGKPYKGKKHGGDDTHNISILD